MRRRETRRAVRRAGASEGSEPLFVLGADRRLEPVTATRTPEPEHDDMLVVLGPLPRRPDALEPSVRASSTADQAATETRPR